MRLAIVILSVLVCQWRLTLKVETGFFAQIKTVTEISEKTRFLNLTQSPKKPGFYDNT